MLQNKSKNLSSFMAPISKLDCETKVDGYAVAQGRKGFHVNKKLSDYKLTIQLPGCDNTDLAGNANLAAHSARGHRLPLGGKKRNASDFEQIHQQFHQLNVPVANFFKKIEPPAQFDLQSASNPDGPEGSAPSQAGEGQTSVICVQSITPKKSQSRSNTPTPNHRYEKNCNTIRWFIQTAEKKSENDPPALQYNTVAKVERAEQAETTKNQAISPFTVRPHEAQVSAERPNPEPHSSE